MKLYISPVEFSNTGLLNRIMEAVGKTFYTKVNKLDLPFDITKLYSDSRRQYFSTGFIEQSLNNTTEIDGKILLLTELDLYVPVLTFVFGEAQLNGKHSIVSICRLHEEFYSGTSNNELLYERTLKEVLHELGHNFGLKHCETWDCVMHSSNNIEEVDIKGDTYCRNCRNGIAMDMEFN